MKDLQISCSDDTYNNKSDAFRHHRRRAACLSCVLVVGEKKNQTDNLRLITSGFVYTNTNNTLLRQSKQASYPQSSAAEDAQPDKHVTESMKVKKY